LLEWLAVNSIGLVQNNLHNGSPGLLYHWTNFV